MIIVDSSAMVEALVGRHVDDDLLQALQGEVHAPHLLDVEVVSVLSGLTLAGKLQLRAAEDARSEYFAFAIVRHEMHGLVDRVCELRHDYTTDDACYLALAEATGAPLYTCDQKLAANGHDADVRIVRSGKRA